MKILSLAAVAAITLSAPTSAAVIIDQLRPITFGAAASQRFGPAFQAFSAAVIDDFTLTSGTRLTSITSRFDPGGPNIASSSSWAVEIYTSPAAAATSLVGDVASLSFAPASVVINNFDVTIALNTTLGPGTYWIGVVPSLTFTSFGQAFAGLSGSGNAEQANPGGRFFSGSQALLGAWAFKLEGAGVPEPASWALLIAGFGLTGAALRRQRRRTATA